MTQAHYALRDPRAEGELAAMKARMVSAVATTGLKAIDKAADLHDYGLDQQVKNAAAKAEADLGVRMAQDPYYLIDENGNPRDNIVEEEKAIFAEKMQEAGLGKFWKADNQMKADTSLNDYHRAFEKSLRLEQIKQVKKWGETSFEANYQLAVEQGNFGYASSLLDGAVDNHFIHPDKAALMRHRLSSHATRAALARQRAGTPEQKAQAQMATWSPFVRKQQVQEQEAPQKDFTLQEQAPLQIDSESMTMPAPLLLDQQYSSLTPEQLKEESMSNGVALSTPSFALEPATGASVFSPALTTPDTLTDTLAAANARGGLNLEGYERAIVAETVKMVTDPQYAGLSNKDIKARIMEGMAISGGENALFEGDSAAYQSFLEGNIDKVLATRNSTAYSKTALFSGGGMGQDTFAPFIESAVAAKMEGLAQSRHNMQEKVKTSDDGVPPPPLEGEYTRLKERFAREKGIKLEDLEDDEAFGGERKDFIKWYYAKGGENERIMRINREQLHFIALHAAVNASTAYIQSGRDNWAEHELQVRQAVKNAMAQEFNLADTKAIADYHASLDHERDEVAKKYREESDKETAVVKQEQKRIARKLANEEYEQAALKETMVGDIAWDQNTQDLGSDMVAYVPSSQYYDVIKANEGGAYAGVMIQIDGRGTKIPCRPMPDIKGVRLNRAALHKIYGRKLDTDPSRYLNPHQTKYKFTITK